MASSFTLTGLLLFVLFLPVYVFLMCVVAALTTMREPANEFETPAPFLLRYNCNDIAVRVFFLSMFAGFIRSRRGAKAVVCRPFCAMHTA
jgi:hypothetical protein